MRTDRTRALTAFAACAALVLAAALVSGGEGGPPGEGRGIDARSYYEEYAGSEVEGGIATQRAPMAGSADAAGVPEPSVPPPPPRVPGPAEDNTFVDAGTSGFVDPARDPRSTFALDVDTGSYGVARTLLRDGTRPPPAAIRVEEWVNAQEYADAAPTGADLGVSTETAPAPSAADGTQLVRVAVGAREVAPEERPRVNLTLVVDRSGSMDIRERLGLVRSSLALLADRLRADDTVSVVSFEDTATVLLEPTAVRETGTILDTIEKLRPGGSTNLADGLRLGYEQARENFDADSVNLVVLASDGVANVGATGPGSITEQITREGRAGIHLVTVGYGMGNYNDHLMEQLADLGDGFYSYVDTYAEAERLFGHDLVTTLTPVAAQARAQVRLDPGLVTSYRLVGYDNRAIADDDFEDLSMDAGELGAGHRATALYEVTLADGVEPGTPIGTVDVRWRSVADGTAQRATAEVLAADPGLAPSDDLLLAATVADLAKLLKDAGPVRDRGLDLAGLRERAVALGADHLVALIDQAEDAELDKR